MAQRVFAPLIIGITGKRNLDGKDAAVRAALREAFALLDRHFANTPKIVLSALAQGADLIAAEEAVRHGDEQRGRNGCSWQVVTPLPLPLTLYLEDFDEHHAKRVCDLRRRIKIRVLPPLYRPVPGSPFARGQPFARAELHRQERGNPARSAHYEQVGLHIADQCGLLIAVMPRDEQPEKTGGTARIVHYRVRAVPDAQSRDIRRRSQVLAPLPLDRPQPGPAWIIDLASLDDDEGSLLSAMELWELDTGEHLSESANIKRRPLTRRWNISRLWLATAIDRFNAQVRRTPEAIWSEQIDGRAREDRGDASSWLHRVRLALSQFQGRYKNRLMKTLSTLAAIFVVAIALLEIHIEFEHRLPIHPYVALIFLSLAIYAVARAWRLQQYSEDYRAISEALRVQLAWWDAGLSGSEQRVERTYLGATSGSLGRVRTAVRHLIDSAHYMASAPKPAPNLARQWLNSQIRFFKDRIEQRHSALSFVESMTWFLFIGAFGMALVLIEGEGTVPKAHALLAALDPARALAIALLVVAGLFFLHQGFSRFARNLSIAPLRWVARMLGSLYAVAAGCAVALLLVQAAIMQEHCGWSFDSHCIEPMEPAADQAVYHLAHKLILIAMVAIIAVAGAMRYRADKLSQEHELLSYRDALETFRRAVDELDEIGADTSEAAQTRRREIFIAAGREALDENEAWIRAHRLRPLEPIVGG
jgi:hypothetical protein